jgi:uncharacterized membrane-anchored protein
MFERPLTTDKLADPDMSSIMRRRNGLIASSVMGMLLF